MQFNQPAIQICGMVRSLSHPEGVSIGPVDEVDFEDVLEYTTSIYGFELYSFLQKWPTLGVVWQLITIKREDYGLYIRPTHKISSGR